MSDLKNQMETISTDYESAIEDSIEKEEEFKVKAL